MLYHLRRLRQLRRLIDRAIMQRLVSAIFGQSPFYIRDLLVLVSEMQGRTRLRSAAAELYHVPFTRTQFGRLAFSVAAPSKWKSSSQYQTDSRH